MFTPEQAEELKKFIDENTKVNKPVVHDAVKVQNAISGIIYGFDWKRTKQGQDYWDDVLINLQTLLATNQK